MPYIRCVIAVLKTFDLNELLSTNCFSAIHSLEGMLHFSSLSLQASACSLFKFYKFWQFVLLGMRRMGRASHADFPTFQRV